MANIIKNSNLFRKESWASLIAIFVLIQIILITFEVTDTVSYLNLKEIDGTIFGRIMENSIFDKWFNFYETAHFNLFTVFFCIVLLIPGVIGAIKAFITNKIIYKR